MRAAGRPALVRSDPAEPGIRRQRCGRGFRYLHDGAAPVRDARTLARIKALVIPPAWQDVWICPDAKGHIQALGTDAAGRRQYRYHDQWREERDQEKHDRVLAFGRILPCVREVIDHDLRGTELSRERVLSAAIRLIDLGFFRAGSGEYAADNGTYGLATIRREHVVCSGDTMVFGYLAKGAKQRELAIVDDQVIGVVRSLKRRRSGGEELLAYRDGGRWHDVTATDINDHLHAVTAGDFTVKDFRTWHATILAAVGLAVSAAAAGATARKRAVVRVVREVADYLGNTPAVARASYIDPRIIELYERGVTVEPALADLGKDRGLGELATGGPVERAVLELLAGQSTPTSSAATRTRKPSRRSA
ncbi:DNA topoisomerase IB [Actinomadura sp. DC4]|uniref:DNA topoisomerase IB n=1 Tax=Actinomadura sp. DC4 TaxID=3055069 RepID=UPI0025B2337E|nr:DNA topoisomerase IB [Actinomadura sp. DC4]MDN3354235.1 DNA topoisomerase IB [Actinomadura sp. DC4]